MRIVHFCDVWGYRERVPILFPDGRWPDPRARLARALAQPRVAVSLVALAALLVGLLVVRPDLGHEHEDALSLAAAPAVPSTYTSLTRTPITFTATTGTRRAAGKSYEYASWTSAWVTPAATFTRLVPSWSASTPKGSWIQVLVQVRDTAGKASGVKDLGRWSLRDSDFENASAGTQADAVARVATDTVVAAGRTLAGYRVTVRLMRTPRGPAPKVTALGAVTSTPTSTLPKTSTPLRRAAVALKVPAYSQMTHLGHAPRYGGGGEAWCSPTSLSMVLAYYGALPPASSYTWVPKKYADRFVEHVARRTYDHTYSGTGNWPFNTAYAATRTGKAFVTRLPHLRTAERFIRAGIPLVVSIKFSRGQLSGAPLSATPGHLVVLIGFTAAGDPIVNDPAAPRNSSVRRTYDRAQFERAWLRGSFGTTYVVHDAKHPLPQRPAGTRYW